jgi:hypothetical protein
MRALAALALALAPALAAAQPGPPSAAEVEADELAAALAMFAALDAACAVPDSLECDIARLNAVSPLSVALVELGDSGAHDADAPRIRPFASANHPRLRWAAAAALGAIRPTAEDTATLLVLLNDPVPAVRAAARAALNSSEDPRAVRIAGAALSANDEAWRPEPFPDPGIALPGDATFLRSFSDPETGALVYAADQSPAEIASWFESQSGRTAAAPDAFRSAYPVAFGGSTENPMQRLAELGQRMATMTFPEQMAAMAELTELQRQVQNFTPEQMMAALAPAGELPGSLALKPWIAPARFADPMIVALAESGDGAVPTLVAIVYRDLVLEETGFALQPIPAGPRPAGGTEPVPPAEDLSRAALLDEAFWTTVTGGASAARYLELFPDARHRTEAERLVAALPGPVAELPVVTPPLATPPAALAPAPELAAPELAAPAPETRVQRRR